MKKVFNAAVFALVAYLVADRAVLHAPGRDVDSASCAQSGSQAEFAALSKGFSQAAASSQGAAFRAQCLVMGVSRSSEAVAMR